MDIVIVYPGKIPAFRYGGTERVIWALGKELSRMGNRVTFLAAKGSYCDFAKIVEIDPLLPLEAQIPEADIVHFNSGAVQGFSRPCVVTIHGNGSETESMHINSIFVSHDHARRFGSESFVHNGLDWDEYGKPDLARERHYFHFLGKAAWRVKNVREAIRLVKSLPGEELEVLGGYRFNIKMGLRLTLSPRIHFHGMVGGSEKFRLLEGSKGLLFPVKWDEPFGLALTESLYFGSPIFGTPFGSLPEIVTPEVGFLSQSRSELLEGMAHAGDYSRKVCHSLAVEKYNSALMAKRYMEKYEIVAGGGSLNDSPPRLVQVPPRSYEMY